MTNTNCLEGMKCPKCGHEKSFEIRAMATFDVTDDGTDDYSSVEWYDDSPCTCKNCQHFAMVSEFKQD